MKTSGELEELNEDAEGAASSITQLQTKLLNLTGGKVNIMEDDSNFKSTYQILTELSQVWGQLEEVQRSQITELVAGIRQGNAFNAVLTNMSEASKVVAYSMKSSGSALEENTKYLDSIAGKASIFNAEWEELSSKTLDSGLIKGILDFGSGVLSWINDIGGLIPILTTVLGLLISIKGVDFAKSLVNPLILLRKKILAGTNSFADLRHSFKVASKDGLNFASTFDLIYGKGTFAMTALKGAVAAVTTAITIAVVAVQAYNQKMRELRQEAVDSAKSLNDSLASINEYKKQISELGTQLDSGNLSEKEAYDVRSQLLEIQEKIIDTYGREAQAIDLLTDKTGASIRKLDQLGRAQVSAWEAENFKAITNARDLLNENTTTQFSQYTTNNNTELVEILRSLGAYEDVVPGSGVYWSHTSGTVQDEIEWLTELSLKLAEYGDTYEDVREVIASKISRRKSDDFIESLELAQAHFESKLMLDSDYVKFYASITEAQERYNTALIEQDEAAKTDALNDLFDLMQQIKQVADDDVDASFFEDLFDSQISAIHANEFSEAVRSDANHIQQTIQGALDKIKTAIASSQDVAGDVNLDNLSLAGIIGSREKLDDDRIGTEGVSELIGLCKEYNLTVDELVDSLVDLGYIQGEVLSADQPTVTDRSAAAIQTAIDSYNTVIDEANQLFAEQDLNPEKLISSQTFDYLVESGSDLVSVLEMVRDEAGNVTGWRIAEDAMNSYIEEQLEAAKATLGSNDALSAHYAALTLYFGELGTYNERVAKATEENEKLGEAYKNAAKGEQFTYSEMQELIQAFPELSFAIDDVTGKYDLNAESVLTLIDHNYELIKLLTKTKIAYLELAAAQEFQATVSTSGQKRTQEAAETQIAFLKRKIEESGATSLEEYEQYYGIDGVKDAAWRDFIIKYTAAKKEIADAKSDFDILQKTTPKRLTKEAKEEKASSSESNFNKQKSQLDMERDALEAGRQLEDGYRRFRLESEADYWDRYEEIVRAAYARNELDAIEYQNRLTEIFEGRQALLEGADSYQSNSERLELEREALKAGYQLEEQYRSFGITSDKHYWETKQKLAREAYEQGEIDANEFQRICMDAYEGLRESTATEYADALSALNREKDKMESGMAWNTAILTDLDDYYDKFEQINEERFKANLIQADEYVANCITIFKGRNSLLDKAIANYEHDIYLWQQQNASGRYSSDDYARNNARMLSTLEALQEMVHRAAEEYRQEMSDVMSDVEIEHSDFIINLQRQWWDYQKRIDEINEDIFAEMLNSYETYIKNCNKFAIWGSDSEISVHERAFDYLENSYRKDLITYERYLTEKLDLLGSMYDAEKQRQQDYVDAALYVLGKEKEALQEELNKYEGKKSDYETMVSTVTSAIDDRIESLRKENEELDKQLELENALEELEKAKSQRIKRVFVEGKGFVWQADEEAVREAQRNYDDLKAKYAIEDQILALEEYKQLWKEVVDSYAKGIDEKITAQILGNNWHKNLTNEMIAIETRGAEGVEYVREVARQKLLGYKDDYKTICDELDTKIEGSTAHQIAQLDSLIDAWQDLPTEIRWAAESNKATLDWAKEIESQNYSARLKSLDTFKNQSIAKLEAIQDAAAEATIALDNLKKAQSQEQGVDDRIIAIQQMINNAHKWRSASELEQIQLLRANKKLGDELGLIYDSDAGVWYNPDGTRAFTMYSLAGSAGMAYYNKLAESLGELVYDLGGYSAGGVVDYTGLALVHGSPDKAETVFNASDSAKLYEYVHSVPNLVQDLVSRLDLNPNIKREGGANVEIKEIHLHDVQNVDEFADAIVRTLPLKLAQKMGK